MRYVTAGESHGRAVVTVVEGVPAGVRLAGDDIDGDLARRQRGYGRGGRQSIEHDRADVLSGVRHGATLGSPVSLLVKNRDWENWAEQMDPFGEPDPAGRVTSPRPGHADLPGILKTAAHDVRDVLERASARETVGRVAAGAVAKAVLREAGVSVRSAVLSIGGARMEPWPGSEELDGDAADASDVGCPDPDAAERMRSAVDAAREDGVSLGGIFQVWATGLVPGVGGYATAGERLDARLASGLVSIPAIKGVEFGLGFGLAALPGSEAHDEILHEAGVGYHRRTNRAGGLEGGMTNGETLVVRAAMKPIPTQPTPLASVDIDTLQEVEAVKERSDVCAVPAAAVVGEAEVALVLADAYTRKFGGDSIADLAAALEAYRSRIG